MQIDCFQLCKKQVLSRNAIVKAESGDPGKMIRYRLAGLQ
jgi:hypothetical protein